MPIRTIMLAELAQEFMAMLESDYSDDTLVEVAIVAEVRNINENGKPEIHTPTACTNDSRVYQTGLFEWGVDNVQWSGERADDDILPPEE